MSGVVRLREVPGARLRLFLLHHAGGSHLVYRSWARYLPDGWEVCAVDAPGRGVQADVPACTDAAALTEAVLADVRPLLDRPFAFFGHSMGALLGYELTLRLLAEGGPRPVWLGLSARGGPRPDGSPDPEQRHLLPDDALRNEVARIGGTPKVVLDDPDLWSMVADLLRADLRVVETWRPCPGTPRLPVPVSVFGGADDYVADRERLERWRAVTPDPLDVRVFDGDHFYFMAHEDEVVPLVARRVAEALASPDRKGAEMDPTGVARADLARCVTDVLGLPDGQIDLDRPLADQGLEPYTAVRLRYRLRDELGLDLRLTDLLGGGSLRSLAGSPGQGTARCFAPWADVCVLADRRGTTPLATLTAAFDLLLARWGRGGGVAVAVPGGVVRVAAAGPLLSFAERARAVQEHLTGAPSSGAPGAAVLAHDTEPPASDGYRLRTTTDGAALRWTLEDTADTVADDELTGMRAALERLLGLLADDDTWQRAALGADPSFQAVEPARRWPFGDVGPLLDDPLRAHADNPAPAVLHASGEVSHAALARHADRLGGHLTELGVGPGDLVAVALDKEPDQITAALAVQRCGAAYVPIDPSWPAPRVEEICRTAGLRHVIVPAGGGVALPDGVQPITPGAAGHAVPRRPAADQLAYAIFTSGSTGTPKGVAIEHRQARTTVDDITDRFGIGPHDRVLGLSALSFDLSVYDIFGVLGAGGALVLPAQWGLRDPEHWLELMAEHRVTVWNTAPALMEMLVDLAEADPVTAASQLSSLRLVMLSGDWIPVTLPDRLRALAPHARLISLGGATEASIWSIWHPVDRVDPAWRSIPYGRALSAQSFHILDEDGTPSPVGEPGELYIGGDGVARGYLGDPEQTARRFAVHPVLGERLYRTGDLGRWLPDGAIEFLGRVDRQVKVQGYRIELGDVESALVRLPRVRHAVVLVETMADGRRSLVAHVVATEPGAGADERFGAELTDELSELLPGYMVPARFVVRNDLPVTANGKVDYAALTAPARPEPATPAEPAAPQEPAAPAAIGDWLAEAAGEAVQRGLKLSLCVSVESSDMAQALTAAGEWTREMRARLDELGVAVTEVAPGRGTGLVELVVAPGRGRGTG